MSHREAVRGSRAGRPRVREPRTALSREQVVDAALRVLDDGGYAALSMRRVAQELGVGTMSLYWHVADREELLDLVYDRVIAVQVLDEVPADWREALRRIAFGAKTLFERNPWILDTGPRPMIGARVLEHVEQSLQATESMELPIEARLAAIGVVDSFVLGFVVHAHTEPHEPDLSAAAQDGLAAGSYPRYAALMAAGGLTSEMWDGATQFVVGLELVLDGVAAAIERGALPATSPPAPARRRRRRA